MAPLNTVVNYLDVFLETAAVPDFPNAFNGLQFENSGIVTKVAASVDFSTRAVDSAARAGANMLLVHHGMFWGGLAPITGKAHGRIRKLIENDIAVYASHLPLDRHAQVGNNVLLARELELEPQGEFAQYGGVSIGVDGYSDMQTADIFSRADIFARRQGGRAVTPQSVSGRRTRHWAICTGAGASTDTLSEAVQRKIDTLIVGEGPHHTAVYAMDLGITVIYAGHYATETLGVRALAKHLSERFNLESTVIDAPTGL